MVFPPLKGNVFVQVRREAKCQQHIQGSGNHQEEQTRSINCAKYFLSVPRTKVCPQASKFLNLLAKSVV